MSSKLIVRSMLPMTWCILSTTALACGLAVVISRALPPSWTLQRDELQLVGQSYHSMDRVLHLRACARHNIVVQRVAR